MAVGRTGMIWLRNYEKNCCVGSTCDNTHKTYLPLLSEWEVSMPYFRVYVERQIVCQVCVCVCVCFTSQCQRWVHVCAVS